MAKAAGGNKRGATVHPDEIYTDGGSGEKQTSKKEKKGASGRSGTGVSASDVETVGNYLRQQNRPYSLIDIFNNLHGAVGKTALQKVLDKLIEDQIIISKSFGKQTVYVVSQTNVAIPSQSELDGMDDMISQLKEQTANLKEQCKINNSKISELQAKLTVPELKERIAKLQQENIVMAAKIQELSSGTRKVDLQEKKIVDAKYLQYSKLMKERKRKCMDALNMITENLTINPREFMQELGMEDDADTTTR
jgi:26S proteasome regulatory subunit (ATPase 3-interacting protein)